MVAEPHLEKLTDGMNDGIYKIDNNSFKPYACCKHSHASLYAMQVLRAENSLKSEDVEEIELLVNNITEFLINNPQPENPYGCKFSIQYCVAGMLKYGDPPNPMSWDESVAKFMFLAVPVYGETKAAKLCKLIETLENSKDFAVDLGKCLA